MKKILIFLTLGFFSSLGFAQTPSDASIDEFLLLSKANKIAEAVIVPMEQMMRQNVANSLQGKQVTVQEKQAIEAFIPKAMLIAKDELAFSSMRPLYMQLYRETFTQEELDGLIAFYKTPAGLATVNKMPAVAQKTMLLVHTKMQPMMQKMQAAMKQAMDDAKSAK